MVHNHRSSWLIILSVMFVLAGCSREAYYDQTSAEATVDSLAEMVRNGEMVRVPELVHADDENVTKTLHAAGVIFHRMQLLAVTIREKYPDEVDDVLAEVKAEALKAADKEGKKRGGKDWGKRLEAMLVDPASAIDSLMERVSVVYSNDEEYALLIDGEPAFGVGIVIRQSSDDGLWYIEWPSNLAGMSSQMPQTDAEWSILRSLLKSVANGVDWTEKAINEGKAKKLEDVWKEAGKEVVPNIVIGWLIYEQAVKHRPKAGDGG